MLTKLLRDHLRPYRRTILLIIVLLTQAKGSGFSGSFSGDSSSIYRTRRGIEKCALSS